jgi:hypothetical protein
MTKKELETHGKEIQKLKEKFGNIEQKFKNQTSKIENKIEEKFNSLDQKFTNQISELVQMVDERIGELDQTIKTITTNLEDKIKSVGKEIQDLQKKLNISQDTIQTQIDAKDEVLTDMIKKFDEQFTKDKRHINEELETLKGQQDVLKISYTVNEKQLLEKIEAMISSEVRNTCSDKEREILMNIWIKELKGIITDFEKLKKMHPQEFNLKMNEIANTIEVFKQKVVK